jgi:RNA polymerase sigma-B factor
VVNPVVLEGYAPSRFPHAIPEVGGPKSADDLVARYHYLCRRGARKFWRAGLERCDLEQVAAIGLIKASRRYDPATMTPFEAYAWVTIVGELMHHVRDHERVVRIPRRLRALESRFQRAQDACSGRLGRDPSDAELAEEMGVLPSAIAELRGLRALATMLPLDDPAAHATASDSPIGLEDHLLVRTALARLSELERRVLVGVYLLGLSQLELARTLGISPRNVSRLRQSALLRMQRAWAS